MGYSTDTQILQIMKIQKFALCIFLYSQLSTTYSISLVPVVEIGPKLLQSFEGYGDQQVFHWPAYHSSNYLVEISATVNQSGSGISVKCASVNVSAAIRQNAIPVLNPRQSILPKNTLVDNVGVQYLGSFLVSPESQGQIKNVTFDVDVNKATNFFAVMFLPYDLERFDVAGLTNECRYYASLKVYAYNVTASSKAQQKEVNGTYLTRKQSSIFNVQYLPINNFFNMSTNNQSRLVWEVFPLADSGGTLDIFIRSYPLNGTSTNNQINMSLIGCLNNEISDNSNCSDGLLELNNTNLGSQSEWHIPYPLSGTWTLDLNLVCDSPSLVCDDLEQGIFLNIAVRSCIDGCEANEYHGDCGIYRSDAILFVACRCKVGWMGLACNDGRNALSYDTQLLHTLLLTLSNLMFIPCVILAIYRKYYTEAVVYFFVLFMSSFYHACDQPGQVIYCLIRYETLQFSDFLSSITAIFFTLIAVAKLPLAWESLLHTIGLIVVAVCVSYDRFNVWTTVIPAVVGVAIVVSQWGLKCHKRKKCYPGKKKTLFSIIPGVVCAGVGLSLYAFVETSENYYLVHSLWHILMAMAVLFLLPVERKFKNCDVYKFKFDSFIGSPACSLRSTRTNEDVYNANDFMANL